MIQGRVYVWIPEPKNPRGGRVALSVVPLPNLERSTEEAFLTGRFVKVNNGATVLKADPSDGKPRVWKLGSAKPAPDGTLIFEPGIGGGRIDKDGPVDGGVLERYIEAARFGEVNSYFHVDRIATSVQELLAGLVSSSLPRVTAVVHAHAAGVEEGGVRDGVVRNRRWVAFQGGHYRLPSLRHDVHEPEPLNPRGEIHLGPGRTLQREGVLAQASERGRYRANASHNAGVIYHEYGHHVCRHLADFRVNQWRPTEDQDNRKAAIEEGTCDYWAAVMLESPHIWALHWGHDERRVHPRSLVSRKTMADFDGSRGADPHGNGTIWAAALWDLRTRVVAKDPGGGRRVDRLVLQMLRKIGSLGSSRSTPDLKAVRRMRSRFGTGLAALLSADDELENGRCREDILEAFGVRGILPETAPLDLSPCGKEIRS